MSKKDKQDKHFKLYQLASDTYFKGVEIALKFVGFFFVLNAFLVTMYLNFWKSVSESGSLPSAESDLFILNVICSGAVIVGGLLIVQTFFLADQLNICREQALFHERKLGGKLFELITSSSPNFEKPALSKSNFKMFTTNPIWALRLLIGSFMVGWSFIFFYT